MILMRLNHAANKRTMKDARYMSPMACSVKINSLGRSDGVRLFPYPDCNFTAMNTVMKIATILLATFVTTVAIRAAEPPSLDEHLEC